MEALVTVIIAAWVTAVMGLMRSMWLRINELEDKVDCLHEEIETLDILNRQLGEHLSTCNQAATDLRLRVSKLEVKAAEDAEK